MKLHDKIKLMLEAQCALSEHENIADEIKKEFEDERLVNQKRSQASKLAWKKHHNSYRRGIKKRSRNMDRELYNTRNIKDIISDLKEALNEAEIERNNQFNLESDIRFSALPGGVKTSINTENNTVGLTLFLDDRGGQGNYRLKNDLSDDVGFENLHENVMEDLKLAMDSFDQSIAQIINKYGLLPTN